MSEQVLVVFKLLGRRKPKGRPEGEGQCKFDLVIQPMMTDPKEAEEVEPARCRAGV